MNEEKSKLQLIGEIAEANNKNLDLIEEINRLNNIINELSKDVDMWNKKYNEQFNIINEAKEECKSVIDDSEHTTVSEFNINGLMRTILKILDKGGK